jgi:putative addiction module component (TIGR02574 family)
LWLALAWDNKYVSAMSKSDILQELPKLAPEDRHEILERICELEESDLQKGGEATAEEKALLDRELEDYRQTPSAGSPWQEVEARIRKPKAA